MYKHFPCLTPNKLSPTIVQTICSSLTQNLVTQTILQKFLPVIGQPALKANTFLKASKIISRLLLHLYLNLYIKGQSAHKGYIY